MLASKSNSSTTAGRRKLRFYRLFLAGLALLLPAAEVVVRAQAQLDFVSCYARTSREHCMSECIGTLVALCPCLYDHPLFPESLDLTNEPCPEGQVCCFNMPPERWDVSVVGVAEAEEACLEGGGRSEQAFPDDGIEVYEGNFVYIPGPPAGESTCACRPPLRPTYPHADIAGLENDYSVEINAPFDCTCPYLSIADWFAVSDGDERNVRCEDFDPICTGTIDPDDPNHAHYEGVALDNTCVQDTDCVVTGSNDDICAAETSTASGPTKWPVGECGCVRGECIWNVCADGCGDGNLDPGEACDDGNLIPGDGCGDTCVEGPNVDPGADGSQYAWGEHLGWLNAEPQGEDGPGIVVGDTELTGWIWAGDHGWISLACRNTWSCSTNDHGVANDGKGNLSGFAWGEHIGWIDFGGSSGSDCCVASGTPGCSERTCEAVICAADPFCCNDNWDQVCAGAAAADATCSAGCAADPFGVRIHGFTGEFSGFAWTEHHGRIDFGAAPGAEAHQVETAWTCPDPDADGVCTASDGCPAEANPAQEDADADTVGDVCDNCPTWSNPAQGSVPFDQTALAASNEVDFTWSVPVDWQLATGSFTTPAEIGTYAVDFFDTGTGTVYTDTGFPPSGSGFWYLWRPNCPAGSYSTGTASEQGDRDGALVP